MSYTNAEAPFLLALNPLAKIEKALLVKRRKKLAKNNEAQTGNIGGVFEVV